MKTILVPTDFSLSADYAAQYAIHLAREMKANIKLCNEVNIPVEAELSSQVSDYIVIDTMEHEAVKELTRTVEKMTGLAQQKNGIDTHQPLIEHEIRIGSITDMVAAIANDPDVVLVVMGISGAGKLGEFLLGSNSREMVETTPLPLLLVPIKAKFVKLNKIAFATDLCKQDIAIIHVLAGFARIISAEILIAHIGNQAADGYFVSKKKIDVFLNEITNKVNYFKIYYQHVLNDTVDDGLDWLAQYGQTKC